jgi:serine/threonine protein kinase
MREFNELRESLKNVTLLARGGQKLVYSAEHPKYGDIVIKLYFSVNDPRSKREIDIGQNSSFDCVPTIFETGYVIHNDNETLYIIEQRINGDDLRKRLERGERFNLSKAVDFLEQGLLFIKQIEQKGIIHRDIKPENIILSEEGKVFFLDFGIARILGMPSLTKTEALLGPHTPGYAAPEQFNNLKSSIDSRTDLFSIGVVTYECLTGKNPFREGSRSALEVLQKTETLTPVTYVIEGDTQQQFMALLSSLMGKYPSRRPRDAEQALGWLNAAKKTFIY